MSALTQRPRYAIYETKSGKEKICSDVVENKKKLFNIMYRMIDGENKKYTRELKEPTMEPRRPKTTFKIKRVRRKNERK